MEMQVPNIHTSQRTDQSEKAVDVSGFLVLSYLKIAYFCASVPLYELAKNINFLIKLV